jgi:hypothetical protein
MANTLIQIKFSDSNSAPTLLNVAEPAYSYVSNTLFIGTTDDAGAIIIGGKAYVDKTNSAFDKANSANVLAQSGFDKANSANVLAQSGFDKANSANVLAQAAFDKANNSTDAWVRTQANAAFDKANSANVIAQAGFDKANSANVLAQAGFDKANTKLDSAGGSITGNITITGNIIPSVANTYFLGSALAPFHSLFVGPGSVNIGGIILSNTNGSLGVTSPSGNTLDFSGISNTANAAFDKANSANVLAQQAYDQANTKFASTGGTVSGDVTVSGNLTVVGQTVYANTETVLIKDNIITLNAAISQSGSPVSNAGIEIDRGSSANASLIWDETNDRWVYSSDGTTYYGIADAGRLDSAFTQANTANTNAINSGTYANAAFDKANSSNVIAQSAFDKANSANVLAQAAYDAANNAGGAVVANTITLGANSAGELVSNAVTLTTATTVTNGLAQLNQILGKLVPQSPGAFPNSPSLSVSTLSTYRMTNFTQTDRTTTASKQSSAGSTVTSVRRSAAYTTNTFADVGPGESGTLTLVKNNVATGAVTFTASSANGTYSDLIVSDSKDYSLTGRISYANFWRSFDCQGSGTVANGWNEIYLSHTGGANTSTIPWYYDDSAPGTPTFATPTIVPSSTTVIYSSTVPHYTSATTFLLGVNVAKLSGDMYPTSNNFFTGTAGGAFGAPTSNNYPAVGITVMARNYLVTSGSLVVNSTSTIISGFGSSSTGPSVTVDNSYSTASQAFTTALANTVLYKTGTASSMEETTITFGSAVGTGSGLAARIINPGTTDTPAYSAGASLFNSQTSTLTANDATIVASTLKHDQINYSTSYLPAGPNLSTGRTGAQYFTFRFVRTSVSKFDIQFTGTIAGMWVALPGSAIDTAAAATNGWIDMSIAYGGAGVPTSGASVGGVVTLNSAVTNHRKTCTFGTVSSSSTATNEIYVRIKLTSGQTVTALTLQTASN